MPEIWIEDDKVVVIGLSSDQIRYYLVPEPFCKKCCLPISPRLQTELCYFCSSYDGPKHFEFARALGLYFRLDYKGVVEYIKRHHDDNLRDHILRLKSDKRYAKPLGIAMAYILDKKFRDLLDVDYVVPVPQHPNSLTGRGYNQAEELAKVISDRTGIPLMSDALVRVKDVKMKRKNRTERKSEITDAFEATKRFSGESILLIDDTLTTGFTADECSKALKNAGAGKVYVFVAGRDAIEYDIRELEEKFDLEL